MENISQCLNELAFHKRSLMQYQEMNTSLSEELEEEGCIQLAKGKALLSQLERNILQQLDSIFIKKSEYDKTSSNTFTDKLKEDNDVEIIDTIEEENSITEEKSFEKYTASPIEKNSSSKLIDAHSQTDSEDELSARTKALVRSAQQRLFAYNSPPSQKASTSLSSDSENEYYVVPKKRYDNIILAPIL